MLHDRRQAGGMLADRLSHYAGRDDVLVLALPRGGVPVAYEIARRLHAPLDVFIVRKLGFPGEEELAMGAIASDGTRLMNERMLAVTPVGQDAIERTVQSEIQEVQRRSLAYRGQKPMPAMRDRVIILVDDGIATGATARAAITALRAHAPKKIIMAAPVAPTTVYQDLPEADDIICLMTPERFYGVGKWYQRFEQISDQEVRDLLSKAERFALAPL